MLCAKFYEHIHIMFDQKTPSAVWFGIMKPDSGFQNPNIILLWDSESGFKNSRNLLLQIPINLYTFRYNQFSLPLLLYKKYIYITQSSDCYNHTK